MDGNGDGTDEEGEQGVRSRSRWERLPKELAGRTSVSSLFSHSEQFLKLDRFIRIMGRFISCYLLCFVIRIDNNRTEVSLNVFTKHSVVSAMSRVIKKSQGICVTKRTC